MFNPEARWDRKFPGEEEEIGEKVEVTVYFRRGKAFPRMFIWKGEVHKVEKVTYHWEERRGEEIVHYFGVKEGNNLYYLSFSSSTLLWRLIKVWEE